MIPLKLIDSTPSSDENYNAINILKGDPLGDGFKVQESGFVEVELQYLAKIQLIQITAHQIYRPKLISYYVKQKQSDTYQYIGAAQFQMKYNPQIRELKSVKLNNVIAKYLRIVFSGDKDSNEVCITSLVVKGQKIDPEQRLNNMPIAQLDEKIQQRLDIQKKYLQRFDQLIFEFNKQVSDYVDQEDYNNADRLQQCVNELKQLKQQYTTLQAKKLVCIQKQDFKMAQKIKDISDLILQIVNKDDQQQIIQTLLHEVQTQEQKQQESEVIRGDRQLQEELQASLNNSTGSKDRQIQQTRRQQQPKSQPKRINSLSELDLNSDNIDFSNLRGNIFNFTAKDEAEYNRQMALGAKKIQEEEEEYKRQQNKQDKNKTKSSLVQESDQISRFNGIEMTTWEQNNLIIENSKFDKEPFEFNKTMEKLVDAWQKEDTKPPELKTVGLQTDLIYKLQGLQINDMILRLLISKDYNHVREAIRFFDAAVKTDKSKASMALTAIKVVAASKNPALLYCCQYLIIRCYVALLQIEIEKLNLQLKARVNFLDVKEKLYKQKDNVVIFAKIQFVTKKQNQNIVNDQIQKLLQNISTQFQQQINQICNILIERCNIPQPGPKSLAMNTLSTLASFPGFPNIQFCKRFIDIKTINEQYYVQDQKELKTNQKYYKDVENRALIFNSLIEQAPWILNEATCKIVMQFISFVLPYTNREAFRNAIINILNIIIQVKDYNGLYTAVNAINNSFTNKRIIQQFYSVLAKHSIYLELQEDDKRQICQIKIIDPNNDNKKNKFEPNICQFCLQKVFDISKVKSNQEARKLMKLHIVTKCPCISICPQCHQAVENIYLPIHMIDQQDCQQNKNFKYKLQLCSKCGLIMQQNQIIDHERGCNKQLDDNQIMCNLCGEILNEGSEALLHYSEGKCKQCIRTNKDIIKLIQQKVN